MIALKRGVSEKDLTLQAAIRRGVADYQAELRRMQTGLAGELYIDQRWEDMNLKGEYYLIHDYYVQINENISHQIDTLFLCKNFLLLLEIKNIAGRIDFEEEKHQFIRTRDDGIVQGFRNPIDQVRRHRRWLQDFIGGSLPVEYAVVFSHSKTIIGRVPKNEAIFHGSGLESHLYKLFSKYEAHVSSQELQQLSQKLLKIKTEPQRKLVVDSSRIRRGVLCKKCDYQVVMLFNYGKFECPTCRTRSNEGLLEALEDYRLLVSEWISNREFRMFFGIDSIDATKRLLKSLNLEYEGSYKDRKYRIRALNL
ncbi:nuclease-related domain-containing protein [Solibacillus sp. FSL H8-0538]|uniref:nuclease-related domain-containing protein n=1 Tax=Solibacillus sp. FSL H8-0538 TaxID=2921400 RepID=UPI0030FAFF53